MRDGKRTIVNLARTIANDYAGKAFDDKLAEQDRVEALNKIVKAANVINDFASSEASYLNDGFGAMEKKDDKAE